METSYPWRITIPSTGEILETASSCKSPNEAVVAAKEYARKNIDPDTPIGITVLDDQKQAVQTLDTTTTAIAAELRARSDRRKTNGGPMGFEVQLWQAADNLGAFLEAEQAVKNGSGSPEIQAARYSIAEQYEGRKFGKLDLGLLYRELST